MADDFFVRFGSNARVFSRQLENDLKGTFDVVGKLGQGLQALEVTAAAKQSAVQKHLAAISEEAAAVQKKLDALGDPGSKGEATELQAIATNAMRQIADAGAQIDGLVGKLGTFVERIGRAGEEYQAAQQTANRAAGQRNSEANQQRVRDAAGRTSSPGTPGAQPFYSTGSQQNVVRQVAAAAAAAARQGGASPATSPTQAVQTTVRIADIPKATIDEASFARVVAVGEQQVEATRAVVTTLDRIAAQLNGSRLFRGGPEPEHSQGESQVEGLARLTKEQNSQLYRAFADILRTTHAAHGEEGQTALWKQLVANQQKALASGGTIIPPGAGQESPAPQAGQRRLDSLNQTIAQLGDRSAALRAEIESLSSSLEQGRTSGRVAAGDAELLGRKLNELAAIEERMTSAQTAFNNEESRAEQRERQRRAAARQASAQAGLTDTPEERRRKQQERQALELSTNPEKLAQLVGRSSQGGLGKRDLQGIAETLTRQGYGVNLGSVRPETGLTRLTIPELIQRIGEAGQQYVAAGRATAEDLRPRREAATSQVSTDVQSLLGGQLSETTQRFTQELGRLGLSVERAYQLIGLSMKTGGQDPRVVSDPANLRGSDPEAYRPNARTARGRLEVGAAIGDELRAELLQAADAIKAFQREVRAAARADVIGNLRRDQLYNPLAVDKGGIQGKGDEAAEARRQLAALLRAADEVDNFARDLQGLDDQVKRTERAWQAVTSQIARFESLDRKPTAEETAQYSRNVPRQAEIEQTLAEQRARLATAKSLYSDPAGGTADFLLEPGFREGLRRRDQYRVASRPDERTGQVSYQSLDSAYAEYEHRDSAQQFQNRAAIRSAVFDYFGRAKIFGTNEGNTTDYFSRALPGVRSAGTQGRQRLEFINDQEMLTGEDGAKNARALRRMTAGIASYSGNLAKLIEQLADDETTEKELVETRAKVVKALGRLLAGYQTAFPTAPVPDERLFLPPQLFGKNEGQLVGSTEGNTGRQARAAAEQAKRDALEAQAAQAYNDPERSEKMRQSRLKEIRASIRSTNEELRGLYDDQKKLTGQLGAATKALRAALGPKLISDIKESEDALKPLQNKLNKGDRLTAAQQSSYDFHSQRIQSAYSASPAIEEAKAARDALVAEREILQSRKTGLQVERDRAREQRKQLSGRIDPGDIEKAYADLQARKVALSDVTLNSKGLHETTTTTESASLLEAQVKRQTAILDKLRQELQAREQATAARLSPESRAAYVATASQKQTIQEQMAALRNSPDFRADRGAAALNPAEAARAEKVEQQLAALNAKLTPLVQEMAAFERLASSLDPRTLRETGGPDARVRPGSQVQADVSAETIQKSINSAEEQVRDSKNRLTRVEQALAAKQAEYEAMIESFRAAQAKRGAKATRDPNVPGFDGGAGGGVGGTAGGGGGEVGPGGVGGPGNGDILREILSAINRVDATLKGGLRVTGQLESAQAEAAVRTAGRAGRPGVNGARSTEAGRADFEASISASLPAIAQLLQDSKNVDAAAALVTQGVLSETRVLELFRDKLKLTAQEAKSFGAEVRAAVGNARLASAAQAAADQQAKEQAKLFTTRTGETLSLRQARQAMAEDIAARKRATEAAVANEREERASALAVEQHRRAVAALSPETRREVAELERMAAAAKQGAISQAELAAQMAKVYGMTAHDLARRPGGTKAVETNQTVGRLYEGAGIGTSGTEVEDMRKEARGLGYQVDQSAASGVTPGGLFGEQSKFTQALFGNHGFWSRIMASTGTFVVRNFTAGFVFGMTAALQKVLVEAVQTEATFVRVSHALEATGRSAGDLRGELQQVSTDLGTNLNDVYKTAAGLTGLFKTPQDIAGATRVVSELQLISAGALSAEEAMGALASIQGAFSQQLGKGVDGLTHVADVLTSVQNDIGTNVEVTAEAVGRMSGLANQLGLSLEEVAVYGAQIAKLTNQTGAAAGDQFSRILSVMQTGRGRNAIQAAFGTITDEQTGQKRNTNVEALLGTRDYSGVLKLMSREWGNLSKAQQQNVAIALGGQRQAAAFAALMANGAQSLNAITRAENSHGAAADRVNKIMQTLNGQFEKFTSNLQNVANNLIRSGVLNFVLVVLQAVNGLLGAFNTIFSKVNDFADNNSVLNWVTNVGFGLAGLALTLTVLKRSLAGFKATLANLPAVQNFQAGYRGSPIGASSEEGAARAVDAEAAERSRLQQAIDRRNPLIAQPSRLNPVGPGGYNAPLSRALGTLLDKTIVPPFNAVGKGATNLADALRLRASEIRAQGAPLSPGQLAANEARASRLERQAGIVGSAGGFFGTIGTAGRETFQGRGSSYFQGVSERQAASAANYQLGAGFLRQQAEDPNFGGQSSALGRQARLLEGLGKGATLASAGTSGLSKTLGLLEKSGVTADVALTAVAVGVGLVTAALNRQAAANRTVSDILAEDAKQKAAAKGLDTSYIGPATQAFSEYQKKIQDSSGGGIGLGFIEDSLKDALTGHMNRILSGDTLNRYLGTTGGSGPLGLFGQHKVANLDDTNALYNQGLAELKGASHNQPNRKITVLGQQFTASFGDTTAAIKATQDDINKKLDDMTQKVGHDSNLSGQQKANALAAIETAKVKIAKMAEDRIAEAQGLQGAGLLELEQLQRLGETTPALGALQANGPALASLQGGVTGLVSETGVDKKTNPEIAKYLAQLQKGGLDAAEVAKGEARLIATEAKQAQIKYVAALGTGEDDQIQSARQEMLGLMQKLAGVAEANVQTFVQTAQSVSAEAFAQGNFTEGKRAIDAAIRNIEAQKPKGTSTTEGGRVATFFNKAQQEQIDQFNAQQRQLIDSRNQISTQQANAPLVRAAAVGNLGEVGTARNQLQQARNALNVLRQARQTFGPLGATVQQMNDAENAVLTASAGLATSLQNKHAAALANRAAGTWNQARQDNISVQQAAYALEKTIDRYGRDSIEALNAMAALANANKQKLQNADARAAAAAQTGIAAIPQGNQVAVTGAQVAAAQAGVAAAQKYGKNSTEYQGALQQLYQAQQSATAATGSIAVAQAQLAQAYAQANGNAVAAAKAGVAVARATLNAALQASGGAQSADVLSAQASLVAANQAVTDAQVQLIQSRIGVTIALAQAAGDTVRAAQLQVAQAVAALHAETPGTAEYNQAKAAVIAARAGARDAALQDQLDTIDFNLQMNRITQSGAIEALRQILRTSDLTKQQRRQILLQIKGMKNEIANSQWNFGDIKLPTPYEMKRYIQQRRADFKNQIDAAATGSTGGGRNIYQPSGPRREQAGSTTYQTINIPINGADTAKVKKIITEVVGSSTGTITKTTSARRRP